MPSLPVGRNFTVGQKVVLLGKKEYGMVGEVLAYDNTQVHVAVSDGEKRWEVAEKIPLVVPESYLFSVMNEISNSPRRSEIPRYVAAGQDVVYVICGEFSFGDIANYLISRRQDPRVRLTGPYETARDVALYLLKQYKKGKGYYVV